MSMHLCTQRAIDTTETATRRERLDRGGIAVWVIVLFLILAWCSSFQAGADTPGALADKRDWKIEPFWRSKKMIDESGMAVRVAPENAAEIGLAFTPTKILSVTSANGQIRFENGRDYMWKPGSRTIEIIKRSRIPVTTDAALHPPKGSQKFGTCRDRNADLLFAEGPEYHNQQVVVSYEHGLDGWETPASLSEPQAMPALAKKIQSRQPVKIVLLGDSISFGWNASGVVKVPPFMPSYGALVAGRIATQFHVPVAAVNLSVSGKDSGWGVTQIPAVLKEKPDLVMLAFGMNDATGDVPTAQYIAHMQSQVDLIRQGSPATQVILIATMTANPEWSGSRPDTYIAYRDALLKMRAPGVAVADVTSVWSFLVERKKYWDLTGNGLNHPNDFGHRVYAQVVWSVIEQALARH